MSLFLPLLLFFGLLFGGGGPKCPPIEPEIVVTPIYKEADTVTLADGTTRTLWKSGETLYFFSGPSTTIVKVWQKVGETVATDTEAVLHNKRVRECQTANGQF